MTINQALNFKVYLVSIGKVAFTDFESQRLGACQFEITLICLTCVERLNSFWLISNEPKFSRLGRAAGEASASRLFFRSFHCRKFQAC